MDIQRCKDVEIQCYHGYTGPTVVYPIAETVLLMGGILLLNEKQRLELYEI